MELSISFTYSVFSGTVSDQLKNCENPLTFANVIKGVVFHWDTMFMLLLNCPAC